MGHAAQRGADAGEQLLGVERLRDVVVGAGVERAHLLRLLVAGGQHDHGHVAERAQAAQHVEPVEVGEAEVEDHDVGAAVGGDHDRRLAGRGLEHLEVAAAQRRAQRAPERGVVFDEEDRAHGRHDRTDGAETATSQDPERVSR